MSSLRPSLKTQKRTYKPAILAPQKTPVATVIRTNAETKITTNTKEVSKEKSSRM